MGDTKSVMPILKEHNQKYFAISDYGECSGWVQQYFTCIKNNIVPILGMETFVNNYRFKTNENNETFINKLGENEIWTKSEYQIIDMSFSPCYTSAEYKYHLEAPIFCISNANYAPFLYMKNQTTGAYHLEGLHPRCKTLYDAIKMRYNGLNIKDYDIKDIK
jgi:hypothetical protein